MRRYIARFIFIYLLACKELGHIMAFFFQTKFVFVALPLFPSPPCSLVCSLPLPFHFQDTCDLLPHLHHLQVLSASSLFLVSFVILAACHFKSALLIHFYTSCVRVWHNKYYRPRQGFRGFWALKDNLSSACRPPRGGTVLLKPKQGFSRTWPHQDPVLGLKTCRIVGKSIMLVQYFLLSLKLYFLPSSSLSLSLQLQWLRLAPWLWQTLLRAGWRHDQLQRSSCDKGLSLSAASAFPPVGLGRGWPYIGSGFPCQLVWCGWSESCVKSFKCLWLCASGSTLSNDVILL